MYVDIATGSEITDYELGQRYADMLDDCYGTVSIAGLEYTTSRALSEVDPIAYRVGLSDYVAGELGETITEADDL